MANLRVAPWDDYYHVVPDEPAPVVATPAPEESIWPDLSPEERAWLEGFDDDDEDPGTTVTMTEGYGPPPFPFS
jgi:hypothetical protein